MNKKPTILAVAALGSLAMIGTGFAGWVITAEVQGVAEGSITAMAVTDNRVNVSVEGTPVIKYGQPFAAAPATDNRANKWFNFETVDPQDALEAEFNFTFTYSDENVTNRVPSISAPVFNVFSGTSTDEKDTFDGLVTGDYIGQPSYEFKNFARNANVITAKLVVTFSYGSHFSYTDGSETKNHPYYHYGEHGALETLTVGQVTKTYAQDAIDSMTEVKKLDQLKFKLTFNINDGGEKDLADITVVSGDLSTTALPTPSGD